MYKKISNKQAHTVTFVALFIPILMILAGLTIDGGMLFVKKAELQLIADNAASAGISILTDEMLEMTEDSEQDTLSNSRSPIITAYDFIDKNNTNSIEFDDKNIIYPYNYNSGDSNISIKVELTTKNIFYFTSVLGLNEKPISAESIASIQIK